MQEIEHKFTDFEKIELCREFLNELAPKILEDS